MNILIKLEREADSLRTQQQRVQMAIDTIKHFMAPKQRQKVATMLNGALTAHAAGGSTVVVDVPKKTKTLTASARKRISESMRARWAAVPPELRSARASALARGKTIPLHQLTEKQKAARAYNVAYRLRKKAEAKTTGAAKKKKKAS